MPNNALPIDPPTSHNFPSSIIIIGAGIFGLSTALSLTNRHPHSKITIIDRLTPPVEDGTSVDTTRCIRADYSDPIYARLAAQAQKLIEDDVALRPYYFKKGMTFVCDGDEGSRFYDIWKGGLDNVREREGGEKIIEMSSPEEVLSSIHGKGGQPLVPESELRRPRKWNKGYCNLEDAFIDARESVRIYYERCLEKSQIRFECGVPVSRILHSGDVVTGVILENQRQLRAEMTLLAAGAWSNSLLDLEGLTYSSAIEVAWIKLTDAEAVKWKNMSITTNLSTGFNIFPPYNGEMKMLRRSPGYCNTITIAHPEDPGKGEMEISYPRTTVTNPGDVIPAEAEETLRDNLRELMPTLADRPFDRTKLCWLSQTPTASFVISPHPTLRNLHVSTGGSAHAWKFLPIIGDLIVDSMEGHLDEELENIWRWGRQKSDKDGGNAPRMDGRARELRDVVRKEGE